MRRTSLVGWLSVCCALSFAMIVLGGVVRLEHAGLSITEWQPIAGAIPPIGARAWQEAFDKYRATPEFAAIHSRIDLDAFRTLFLLEYAHRLLGRVTGFVLAAPLLYWLARRRVTLDRVRPLLVVLGVGVLQGALGWAMVKSGLVDAPRVSPQLLASHLVVGVAIFAALVWTLTRELQLTAQHAASPRVQRALVVTVVIATATIAWGGLMAGTHAGLVFPTFPKMGGAWMPLDAASLVRECASGMVAIHFTHRLLALLLVVACIALAWLSRRGDRRARVLGRVLVGVVLVQIVLGALVVLEHVPVVLASLHQANAVVLVGVLAALARQLVLQSSGEALATGARSWRLTSPKTASIAERASRSARMRPSPRATPST